MNYFLVKDLPDCKAGAKIVWNSNKKRYFAQAIHAKEIIDVFRKKDIIIQSKNKDGWSKEYVEDNYDFFRKEGDVFVIECSINHISYNTGVALIKTNGGQIFKIDSHELYLLICNSKHAENTTFDIVDY